MSTKHFKSIAFVIAISLSLSIGSEQLRCYFQHCLNDDAGNRAFAFLGIPVLIAYAIVTVLFVFLTSTMLKPKIGSLAASFIAAALFSTLFSWFLYQPAIDSASSMLGIFLWLLLPWVLSCYIGLKLWPNKVINYAPSAPDAATQRRL